MKRFVIGLIVGIFLIPLAALLYLLSGSAPVATSDPMIPFEKVIAGAALHARVEKEMPKEVPVKAEEATYSAGAMIYIHQCAVCHGFLDQKESAIAKGMFPHPPQLLAPGHGVTDDPPGETFWKVKNGIRLTGMPGFHATLSDVDMWQVSVMLANADKLPDAVKNDLKSEPVSGAPSTAPTPPKRNN